MMPFGLKNTPTIFSRVVVTAFKYFIQNFLQVYMDDLTFYGLIRDHLENLWLMLERCWQHHIALKSKKCIFCTPFGMLLGHIVCKQGFLVDSANIVLILSLPPPRNVKQLRAMLGHIGYYHKFIYGYATIRAPMDRFLKKDVIFVWSQECQESFDTLKAKMASAPILVFPD